MFIRRFAIRNFGSAQESEDAPFLRCLAENEEFGLERRQPLRLQ